MMLSFKNRFSIVLLLLATLFISGLANGQIVKDYPLINSVYEINKNTPDTCRINAFVSSVYNCPPCPKGMICKPCPGNYVMIADSVNGKKQFRVFVNKTANFTIDKKYLFNMRLYKYNSQQEVYEGRLVERE